MQENLFIQFVIFITSLILLIFSAKRFIHSSERIGLSLGIPSFVIGVTVVALGTSLPELVSSVISIFEDSSEIVIGNVVGSNITNIFLILGVVAIIAKKFTIHFDFKKVDLPFFVASAVYLFFTTRDQNFTMLEGIIAILLLIFYITTTILKGKVDVKENINPTTAMTYVWLLLAGVGIYFGAKYNVESVINMGNILKISPAIIALTAVALGTSLPELFVSIAAIRQGNAEIAVGNVLGSNIFNALAIMGIPRLFGSLNIPAGVNQISLPILIISSAMFVIIIWNKKINWISGLILVLGYIVFLYLSFVAI